MKRNYQKPEIRLESFALTQSIAMSCGFDPNNTSLGFPTHADKTSCGWSDGIDVIWTTVGPCNDEYSPDIEVNGVCYNEPSGIMSIFAS